VFARSGSTWTQQSEKLASEGTAERELDTQLGASVALSSDGDTALVGSRLDPVPGEGEFSVAAATVFTRSGSTWTQQGPQLIPVDQPDRTPIPLRSSCPPTAAQP
jgi:hypothetical protein